MKEGRLLFVFCLVLFYSCQVFCDVFYGKLILKSPSNEKRHSIVEKTPAVFATRRTTFLKKNGDVFKIHLPGITQKESSVSFESMRFPNYFLTNDWKEDKFKIVQRNSTANPNFEESASFIVERRAGIEGSGMLRLASDPDKYMCIRRGTFHNNALQALKKENTEDFKYRCSFFIQKLREDGLEQAIKKSVKEGGRKKESVPQTPSKTGVSIDGLLAEFNKKLEYHQHNLELEAASNAEKTAALAKKKGVINKRPGDEKLTKHVVVSEAPSKKASVHKPEKVSSKNIKISKNASEVSTKKKKIVSKVSTTSAKKSSEIGKDKTSNVRSKTVSHKTTSPLTVDKHHQQPSAKASISGSKTSKPTIPQIQQYYQGYPQQQPMYNMFMGYQQVNPYYTPNYYQGGLVPNAAFMPQTKKMTSQKGSTRNKVPSLSPLQKQPIQKAITVQNQNQNDPALQNAAAGINQISGKLILANNQNQVNKPKQPSTVKVAETRLIGPKYPINLHDFPSTHNHREPSLNLDGLVHSVKLPATRSHVSPLVNVLNKTGTNHNLTVNILPNRHPSNNSGENAGNVFYDIKDSNQRIETDAYSSNNDTLSVTKINDEDADLSQRENATMAALNSTVSSMGNETEQGIINSTSLTSSQQGVSISTKNKTNIELSDDKETLSQNTTNLLNNTKLEDTSASTSLSFNKTANATKYENNSTISNAEKLDEIANKTESKLNSTSPLKNSTNQKEKETASIIEKDNSTIAANQTIDLLPNLNSTSPLANTSKLLNNSTKLNNSPTNITASTGNLNQTIPNQNATSINSKNNNATNMVPSALNTTSPTKKGFIARNNTIDEDSQQGSKKNSTEIEAELADDGSSDASPGLKNATVTDEAKSDSTTPEIKNATLAEDSGKLASKNATVGDKKTTNVSDKKNTTLPNISSSEKKVSNQTEDIKDIQNALLVKNETSNADLKNSTSSVKSEGLKSMDTKNKTMPSKLPETSAQNHMESNQVKSNKTEVTPETKTKAETINTNKNTESTSKLPQGAQQSFASNNEMKQIQQHQLNAHILNPETKELDGPPTYHDILPDQEGYATNNKKANQKPINTSITYGASNENPDNLDEVSASTLANAPAALAQSPEDQNAELMQSVRGAVNKINEQDVQTVNQQVKDLENEDKSAPTIANALGMGNPQMQSMLLNGYGINRTLANDTGIEDGEEDKREYGFARSEMTLEQPLNLTSNYMTDGGEDQMGDARSKMPSYHPQKGFIAATGSNRAKVEEEGEAALEKLVPIMEKAYEKVKENGKEFHEKQQDLSENDKDRYNELNHVYSGSEHQHYLNDDSMHPPTTQNSKQQNDLHHQYHGVINDDAMNPPQHTKPHGYFNEAPTEYPTGTASYVKHTATDHVIDEEHHPIIGSPVQHPTTLYESDHYIPGKDTNTLNEDLDGHLHLGDETNVQHHTHHVVTVKSEAEKQKMVHGLVDLDKDKCVSLQIINDIGRRYRLVSSINKHGYTPRGQLFTLKTVFKDPSAHKLVLFKAIDELEPGKEILIDGKDKLVAFPTSCNGEPKTVHVTRMGQRPSVVGCGSSAGKDCVMKKSVILSKLRAAHAFKKFRQQQVINFVNTKRSKIEQPKKGCSQYAYNAHNPTTKSCCVFPFMFGGTPHSQCIKSGARAWCGTTDSVDRDKRWGLCIPSPKAKIQNRPAQQNFQQQQQQQLQPQQSVAQQKQHFAPQQNAQQSTQHFYNQQQQQQPQPQQQQDIKQFVGSIQQQYQQKQLQQLIQQTRSQHQKEQQIKQFTAPQQTYQQKQPQQFFHPTQPQEQQNIKQFATVPQQTEQQFYQHPEIQAAQQFVQNRQQQPPNYAAMADD